MITRKIDIDSEILGFKSNRSLYESQTMTKLLREFDLSHPAPLVIRIGGTNGKGSVTRILSRAFRSVGKSVGSFYTPHLLHFKERIERNEVPISKREYRNTFLDMKPKIEEFSKENREISFFELMLLLACAYFKKKHVDVAIFEVGLGGERDATKALDADLGVLTNVSRDHAHILGNTVDDILREKCGLIPSSKTLVFGGDRAQVPLVQKECENRGARFHFARDETIETGSIGLEGVYVRDAKMNQSIELPLIGHHQQENLVTALATLKAAQFPMDQLRSDFAQGLIHPFRMEPFRIRELPLFLDGSHNEAGLLSLVEFLKSQERPFQLSLCVRSNKVFEKVLPLLQPYVDSMFSIPGPYWKASQAREMFPGRPFFRSFEKLFSFIEKRPSECRVITGSLKASARLKRYLTQTSRGLKDS